MDATDEDDGSNDIVVTLFSAERLEVAVSIAEESAPADDDTEYVGSRYAEVSSASALELEDVSVSVASESAEEAVPADDDIEGVGTRNVAVYSTSALKLEDVSLSSRTALVIEEEVYIINLLRRSPVLLTIIIDSHVVDSSIYNSDRSTCAVPRYQLRIYITCIF